MNDFFKVLFWTIRFHEVNLIVIFSVKQRFLQLYRKVFLTRTKIKSSHNFAQNASMARGSLDFFFFKSVSSLAVMWYDIHFCYKTDFLFAKSWGPQSYFRYTILNTKWTLCASMRKKINKVHFLSFEKKINVLCATLWEMGQLRAL